MEPLTDQTLKAPEANSKSGNDVAKEQAVVPPPSMPETREASLLKLQQLFADPACPSMQLCREARKYKDTWKVNQKDLATLLPNRTEASMSQLLKLLSYPDEVQANLDGFVLSKYNLEILSRTTDTVRLQLSQELKGGSLKLGEFNSRAVKLDPKLSKPQNNASKSDLNQEPEPSKPSKPIQIETNASKSGSNGDTAPKEDQSAKKTPIRGKDSQDKTTGELLVSVIIGLFFVPGYLYCWLVRQRAAADLKELEERAYINAVSIGTWNFVRWVVVGVILLLTIPVMFWATWPRIKQGIHWIHTLKTAATTIAPAPAPAVAVNVPLNTASPSWGEAARQTSGVAGEGINRGPSPRKKASSPLASPGLRPPSPSGRGEGEASLVTAGDASNVMKALAPQTPGVAQRLSNALADIAGKAVTAPGAPAPAAKKLAPGPKNLRWSKDPAPGHPNRIMVEWDSAGENTVYNFFDAPYSNPSAVDRDGYLLKKCRIHWTPDGDGEQVFLIHVTSVNSQGEESAPSQSVMVDLR